MQAFWSIRNLRSGRRPRRNGLSPFVAETLENRWLLSVSSFSFSSGFTGNSLTLNSGAAYSGTQLQLTDGGANQARSAFYSTPVPLGKFTSDFTVDLSNATDNGFTFALQNSDVTAVGTSGAGLGYAGIGTSAAIEFNIASGASQTGIASNGAISTPTDLTSAGINFHDGDPIAVHLSYDGSTLSVTEQNTVTSSSATQSYTINLASTLGASEGYIGFTAGTGAGGMNAMLSGWDYNDTTGVPALGINIRRLRYNSGDELFADAMKETGSWSTNMAAPQNYTGTDAAPSDSQGWPTTDAAVDVISNNADDGGTYALTFTGQASVAPIVSESGIQVKNAVYNSGTNTTTAQIVVPVGASQLMLDFTNTRRLATDTTATGIANVQLMRPISTDSATSYPSTTLFTPPILHLISTFSTVRYMDFNQTNSNPQVNWSDRTLVNDLQSTASGGAWEYAVALANATARDMWINIPEMATDAYVTDLAELIHYGSDGVNPYTGPEGSAVNAFNPNPVPASGPVWAGLNPNLHVYIEYSNEVWNSATAQYGENLNAAVASVNAGNSPLNFDNDGSEYDWAVRHTAMRILQTSDDFRSVFGNSQMMSKIRPVYEWQYSNGNDTAALGLQFLNDYYNNADGVQHVANPHPVDYYLWGGGGAWYGGVNNPAGSGDVTVPQGGFATPAISLHQQDPTGSAWTFSGAAGIVANASAMGEPNAVTGTQAAYIQGTGSFSQTINFTTGLADLQFSAATSGTETFSVSVDGVNVSNSWTLGASYAVQNTLAFNTGSSPGPHVVQFTGISGTGTVFFSNVTADTANAIYNSGNQSIASTIQSQASWAAAFGLHMAGYEGGFVAGTGLMGTPLQIAANQDPRAQAADLQLMDEFYQSGGDLAMYFDTTAYIWALTLDIANQSTPKIEAVESFLSQPQPALGYGATLPASPGQSITVANALPAYSDAAGLYPLRAVGPGTYTVTLTGYQSGAEVEQFFLDGQALPGLTALPSGASGSSAPALTFTIATPGLHALLVVPQGSGSITPSAPAGSITITAGAGPALPSTPGAPGNLQAQASGLAQVNLNWSASAGATGYRVERSANGGSFIYLGSTISASYSDTISAPGSSDVYQVTSYNTGGYGASSTASITTQATNVPAPWSDGDVGGPWAPGYANYTAASATWTVAGGGSDIWNTQDEFNFLSQSLSGDGTIVARVASIAGGSTSAKAGVMFRASLSGSDVFVGVVVEAGGGIAMEWRLTPNTAAKAQSTSSSIVAPQWVKLVRSGNTFTGYYSSDGSSWTAIGVPVSDVLPAASSVGLAVSAHNNAARATAMFTNVAVTSSSTSSNAAQLAMTAGPSSTVTAGSPIAASGIQVAVETSGGSVVSTDSSTVTLTLSSGVFSNGSATATAAAVKGIATFSNLIIDVAGSYSITATDGSLSAAKSATFAVTPAAVSLSKSLVTLASASIASGSTEAVTLTAKDAFGNTLSSGGLSVAFALAGSGTSAGTLSAITDHANGIYTAVFTATTVGTARQISATLGGQPVTSTLPTVTVTSASTNDGPISTKANTISATEGRSFTSAVAWFEVTNTSAPASHFTASINWGDGSSSAGTLTFNSGNYFTVTGTHAYSSLPSGKSFPVTVLIKDIASGASATVASVANVSAAPLVAGSAPTLTVALASGVNNQTIATFTDDNPLQTSSSAYNGTITWGDGTTSAASFNYVSTTAGVGTNWNVLGTHKYAKVGTYSVSVAILEPAVSQSLTMKLTITVK